ncbi:hypothetical protein NMG60_11000355 [Bertholletia excelsa]
MALPLFLNNCSLMSPPANPDFSSLKFSNPRHQFFICSSLKGTHCRRRRFFLIRNRLDRDSEEGNLQENEVNNLGVEAALAMLRFYKREISPLLLNSCRYVPTCSEYSMIAYKKYGVAKGTILTAWRLCRCNPLGGSGFDPPRWFDEKITIDEREN